MTLPYNGLTLDRAGSRRTDPDWVAAASEHATALALWRDGCLVRDGRPVIIEPTGEAVFLGMDGDDGLFAVDLSDMDEQAAPRDVDSVRYQAFQAWPFPSGLMVGFLIETWVRDAA